VVLQMCAAKQFGFEHHARLDPMTVGMPHPEAYAALMSGKTEITSHLASAPFSYQEAKNPSVHRVLSTAEVLGRMSILLTMTQRQFAAANPVVMRAFLAAQDEANALIAGDPNAAVTAYLESTQLKTPREELLAMLADPENSYSTAPAGSLTYAAFLAGTGVLKAKPAVWTDLFLPELHSRNGN
jgi:NitT/TauT family transport system substrate-binding protein